MEVCDVKTDVRSSGLFVSGSLDDMRAIVVENGKVCDRGSSGVSVLDKLSALMVEMDDRGFSRDVVAAMMDKVLSVELVMAQASLEREKNKGEGGSVGMSGTSRSLPSQLTRSSRASRKAVRQQKFLRQCAEVVEQEGFCYLRMVRMSRRLVVKEKIGAFPDLAGLFEIQPDDVDLLSLNDLVFVREGERLYHMREQVNGDALRVLRNTLACFPTFGTEEWRVLLNVTQFEDYDVLPYQALVGGTESTAPRGDMRVARIEHETGPDTHLLIDMLDVDTVRSAVGDVGAIVHLRRRDGMVAFANYSPGVEETFCLEFSTHVTLLMKKGEHLRYGDVLLGSDLFSTLVVVPRGVPMEVCDTRGRIYVELLRLDVHAMPLWKKHGLWPDAGLVEEEASLAAQAAVFVVWSKVLEVVSDLDMSIDEDEFDDATHFSQIFRGHMTDVNVGLNFVDHGRVAVLHGARSLFDTEKPLVLNECAQLITPHASVSWRLRSFKPVVRLKQRLNGFSFSVDQIGDRNAYGRIQPYGKQDWDVW